MVTALAGIGVPVPGVDAGAHVVVPLPDRAAEDRARPGFRAQWKEIVYPIVIAANDQ